MCMSVYICVLVLRVCGCFYGCGVQPYQRAESNDLENWFHEEEGGKHNVKVLQDFIIRCWSTVKLEIQKKKEKRMRTVHAEVKSVQSAEILQQTSLPDRKLGLWGQLVPPPHSWIIWVCISFNTVLWSQYSTSSSQNWRRSNRRMHPCQCHGKLMVSPSKELENMLNHHQAADKDRVSILPD